MIKHTIMLIFMVMSLFMAGCATTARDNRISFKVRSEPPGGQVEVNGISMGSTPTTISLGVSRQWIGIAFSQDGWEYGHETYRVTCYPPPGWPTPLLSQTKVIQPGMMLKGGEIYFNLTLEPYVHPQRIEIDKTTREDITITTPESQDATNRLRRLLRLLDDKLITKEEYDARRQAILDSL